MERRRKCEQSLTHERLVELVNYDAETGEFSWRQTRSGRRSGTFGFVEKNGYSRVCIDGERYLLHRLAWFYVTGKFPVNQLDHIDRNNGNNRFFNLREATSSENNMNVGVRQSNSSGATNIWYEPDRMKFRVGVKARGKTHYAGRFDTFDAALVARNDLVQKLHQEFGVLL